MPEHLEWTEKTDQAAQLVAEDTLTQQEIADTVGIVRSTLWGWRKHPDFIAKVASITEELRRDARQLGIAVKENRLRSLDDRWRRLNAIILQRARHDDFQGFPGGNSGLMGRVVKWIGNGENRELVVEHELDVGLLREIREVEKQAAMELGQWTEAKGDGSTDDIWSKALKNLEVQLSGGPADGGALPEPQRPDLVQQPRPLPAPLLGEAGGSLPLGAEVPDDAGDDRE